jgi:hypothetical protein
VAVDAVFAASILTVTAVDDDIDSAGIRYSKVSESTGDYFFVDQDGTVKNARLLSGIPSRSPRLTIEADDNKANISAALRGPTATVGVQVIIMMMRMHS